VSFLDRHAIGSWELLPFWAEADPNFLGGKGRGLLSIPRPWTPPFLFLTKNFRRDWETTRNAESAFRALPDDDRRVIDHFLHLIAERGRRILVRSNSPREEGLTFRGIYRSCPANPIETEVHKAIDQVLDQDNDLLALLQMAIEPGLPGHMSNERRVAPRRSLWLIEGSDRSIGMQRVEASKAILSSTELIATTDEELFQVLRSVAATLQKIGTGYFHCEWIWDRNNIWLVQADEIRPRATHSSANSYLDSKDAAVKPTKPEWSALHHFSEITSGHWRKLRRPQLFQKCGIPAADVYLLAGDDWVAGGGRNNALLVSDLRALSTSYVVIRCDVNSEQYTFLPTSAPSKDPGELLDFMEQTFRSKSVPDSDWAFLLANLVPARVSAMVQAFPAAERVRVDALWGFPDGLLHFPHDSYFFYPNESRTEKVIRFKGQCLLYDDGAWAYYDVDRPDDWESTLNDEEVKTLGTWALRIAKELNQQVQLMALARIGGRRGPSHCLPWHYTTFEVPKYSESVRQLPMSKEIRLIQSYEDLNSPFTSDSTTQAYILRPIPSLLRDTAFLQAVGRFVATHNTPLYFEGSLLGHAYYVLSDAGARVVPIVYEDTVEATVYHKLVRDEIPTIIRRAGGLARLRSLSRQEARIFLARKLLEEALEVWRARDTTELPGELADVLEVVDALREQSQLSVDHLEELRNRKKQARGGFQKLVYLEETRPGTLDASHSFDSRLPLFSDEETWELAPETKLPDVLILDETSGRIESFRIEISMFPPIRAGAAMEQIRTETKNHLLVAQYQNDRIVISVSRRQVRVPSNQLQLFEDLYDAK